jgi:hypothetical protein
MEIYTILYMLFVIHCIHVPFESPKKGVFL